MGEVLNKRILRAQQKYGIKCTICGISAGSFCLSGSLPLLFRHSDFWVSQST